ncbi:unnamed protein product [Strongylus vulgaris]|uniref:Uncharacterized protein n=1 Tax=Strongylus vulgaris TaxID=40348 RepID=A0A3P7J254_STRVU|nr:unnamed protein product [Strongylus vulgaris]
MSSQTLPLNEWDASRARHFLVTTPMWSHLF